MNLLQFVLGLILLVAGAEALVRGASRLASALGVSPLLIGLTVVAFGTSSPELAVSLKAALRPGGADLAVGNVLGSNIFNVLFILGLSALVAPLVVSQQLVRMDVPILIGVSALLLVLARDGSVSRGEGGLLGVGLLAYLVLLYALARRGKGGHPGDKGPERRAERRPGKLAFSACLVVAGLLVLVWGSQLLVAGAVGIAAALGVSQLVIGLTIVAGGTSLPEAATSVMASLRGERDIAVGNIVGSNLFNILAVLGLSALAAPHGLAVAPGALHFDLPVTLAVAVLCLPVFFTGHRVSRGEGALFLVYYAVYVAYVVLSTTRHEALPAMRSVLFFGVVPLTVLTLVVSLGREMLERRRRQP